ncbi:hypothetical protein M3Y97_00283100 [Aphelenchoides bicaudatus]|nr:hypothetical protein M3Y97_00283100 [Aphelenchoides bicaudatus]
MNRQLFTLLCILAICVLGSQALKCYFGFSDGSHQPTQFEESCKKNVNFCGQIYDPTDGAKIASCDDSGACSQVGTFNETYFTLTCCAKDDCNKLS